MEIKFTESYTAAADGSVTCEIDVGGNKVLCRFTAGDAGNYSSSTSDTSGSLIDDEQLNALREKLSGTEEA